MGVLNFLGFLAVMTNASMIAFVGDQFAHDAVDLVGSETGNILERGQQWELWISFVLVEHGILFLRVFLAVKTPDVPTFIAEARETLKFRTEFRYKTGDELARERQVLEEYQQRLESMALMLRSEMLGKSKLEIFEMLEIADVDESRSVEIDELERFFKLLRVEISAKELEATMTTLAAVSPNNDNAFNFDDFFKWLEQENIWEEPVENDDDEFMLFGMGVEQDEANEDGSDAGGDDT
eukprot:SAG31_NODE_5519_length_2482_cov_2.359211_1_plen_238_part_00